MPKFCSHRFGIIVILTVLLIKDVQSAEIGISAHASSTALHQNCSDDVVVACAYPLNANQLRFTLTKEDLSAHCPDLHRGLRCIDNYTRTCLEPHQRSHFNHLYSGTSMVIHEICTEGPLQDEFLRHAPCMNKVRYDYEVCANQYQDRINFIKKDTAADIAAKDDNVEKICCALQEYLRCSKNMVKKSCGEETAKFASGFLDKMSNSFLEHCDKSSLYEHNCRSSSPAMPSRSPLIIPLILSILTVILIT